MFRHSVRRVRGNFLERTATSPPRIYGTTNHPAKTLAIAGPGFGICHLTTWTKFQWQLVAALSEQQRCMYFLANDQCLSSARAVKSILQRSSRRVRTASRIARTDCGKAKLLVETSAAGLYACCTGGRCKAIYDLSADRKSAAQRIENEHNARGKRKQGRMRRCSSITRRDRSKNQDNTLRLLSSPMGGKGRRISSIWAPPRRSVKDGMGTARMG